MGKNTHRLEGNLASSAASSSREAGAMVMMTPDFRNGSHAPHRRRLGQAVLWSVLLKR